MNNKKPDFYQKKAKKEHYPARSVYKLEEIDKKHRLLKKGLTVLDLGSTPGSWIKYTATKIGPSGHVVGIDINPLPIQVPENASFIQSDIFEDSSIESIFSFLTSHFSLLTSQNTEQGKVFDLVLSDMAPATSGIKSMDHQRSLNLAFRAIELAETCLKKGGSFLCKFFQGEDNQLLFDRVKQQFVKFHIEKPASSRKQSFELFVLGIGKK